ncbi:MAG TPA: sensor histidine kinase [Acidimicrobiales bacterium]|nr:sensor histidine kinase [Acidimicrobiales bacterium]
MALHLAALTSLTAGATVWLVLLDESQGREPALGAVDWSFTVATIVVFVPFAWLVALAFGRSGRTGRTSEPAAPVAPVILVLVLLFALNRYDALVAAGAVDTVYLQPFALPALLMFAGARGAWQAVNRPRSLTALRERAATDERQRIARDLHDSVSQTLYSIAMVADALPLTVERDPAAGREQARQIRSMTLDTLGNLRILLLEMRRPAEEAAPLGDLLHELGGTDAPVVVELDIAGDAHLPPEVELAAYRVAQEALVNAHRHADPQQIVVRLEQAADALTLRIVDDGAGFDPRATTAAHHGLEIMRERAEQVAARLTVESDPGRGTQVTFSWPRPGGDPIVEEGP